MNSSEETEERGASALISREDAPRFGQHVDFGARLLRPRYSVVKYRAGGNTAPSVLILAGRVGSGDWIGMWDRL